jgi:PKD repeat protein
LKRLAIPLLAFAAAWLARAASAPTISIELSPPNPSAGQSVKLGTIPAGAGPDWFWDFGDGRSSTAAAPEHAWDAAGDYTVSLSSAGESVSASVTVSPAEILRLFAAHPFEISIDAVNPHDGQTYPSRAVGISDRFGWFSFPEITGDPANPEVTVKLLEARADGHYWIFWSAMTSLEYTMTVRDVTTGHVEVYRKDSPEACGGWDTRSFPIAPPPTPSGPTPPGATATPTQTPPVVETAPAGSTRTPTRTPTHTPARTATPTSTPTSTPTPTITATPTITLTPTITPVPPPPLIYLRARQWQWDFCPGVTPCQPICPAPSGCGNEITLHVGQTYQVQVYNGDAEDVIESHTLQTISSIGLQGGTMPQGGSLPLQTITPMTAGDFAFNCTTYCGVNHDDMIGVVHVVP